MALRVRDDAEELAIRAEVTQNPDTEFAAMVALHSWLTLDVAANTGSEEEVEIALDLVKEDFPELLTN